MTELRCPACSNVHWVIDSDYRWEGGPEEPYEERLYRCPSCMRKRVGHAVHRQAPPEFFLQPSPLYPMTLSEFGRWLKIFIKHFPDDPRLQRLGSTWYPTEFEPGQMEPCRARLFKALGVSEPCRATDAS